MTLWADLAEKAGESTADHILDQIEKTFARLLNYPASGPSRDEVRPGLRVTFALPYAVYYRFDAQFVWINRVLYSRMDVDRAFGQRLP